MNFTVKNNSNIDLTDFFDYFQLLIFFTNFFFAKNIIIQTKQQIIKHLIFVNDSSY